MQAFIDVAIDADLLVTEREYDTNSFVCTIWDSMSWV